jgi:hypothetical protein
MEDLLEIVKTLLEFFAFVLLATAIFCIPVVVLLWSAAFAERLKTSRRSRRHVVPLTKSA